jgi:hypothetical protein
MMNSAAMRRSGLAVVFAFVLNAGIALWPRPPSGPFWEKYQQVRFSMTEKEVMTLLGPPTFEEYPGGSLGDSCYAWDEGEQTIAVTFDCDGKMVNKGFRKSRNSKWITEGQTLR